MPSPPLRQDAGRENPFASFYDSRRQLSVADPDAETSDPPSSITRAYIVPDALIALSRREVDGPLGSTEPGRMSLIEWLAIHPVATATRTTSAQTIRRPLGSGGASWLAGHPRIRALGQRLRAAGLYVRDVRRIAARVVQWLGERRRRSLPE